jgi:RNA polymerase sigma-70 factor (ECF subfamily)
LRRAQLRIQRKTGSPPRSTGYHYLHSIRGELLRRLGRVDEARDAYTTALGLVHDEAERRLLMRRQAAVRPVAS